MANGVPNYLPGMEPDNIQKLLNSFFAEIDSKFPDKTIVWTEWNHERWDKAAGYLCNHLGYDRGADFLNAYGYQIIYEQKSVKDNSEKKYTHEDIPDTSPKTIIKESHIIEVDKNAKKSTKKRKSIFSILMIILSFISLISVIFGAYNDILIYKFNYHYNNSRFINSLFSMFIFLFLFAFYLSPLGLGEKRGLLKLGISGSVISVVFFLLFFVDYVFNFKMNYACFFASLISVIVFLIIIFHDSRKK